MDIIFQKEIAVFDWHKSMHCLFISYYGNGEKSPIKFSMLTTLSSVQAWLVYKLSEVIPSHLTALDVNYNAWGSFFSSKCFDNMEIEVLSHHTIPWQNLVQSISALSWVIPYYLNKRCIVTPLLLNKRNLLFYVVSPTKSIYCTLHISALSHIQCLNWCVVLIGRSHYVWPICWRCTFSIW